jgi:hypothetical protein
MMGETNTREVKCNIERTSLQWKKDILLVRVSKKIGKIKKKKSK